jgi:hypothetical protein
MDKKDRLYRCNLCNKEYSGYKSLWNHNNKFHKDNITNDKSMISNLSVYDKSHISQKENIIAKYNCQFCNKNYIHFQSRWKHEKTCKEKNNKLIQKQINNNIIQNNNNINTGTINNNNQKQIIINQIGTELISCLSVKEILKIIDDNNNMPITCIKKLNFNKNIPENHSFCTTTLEGKHFTRINHKTQKPEKINKIDFINEVLESSLRFINNIYLMVDFDDSFRDKIPSDYQDKIKDIIDNQHKFHEAKNKKAFFNCINDMSYNFKDIIFETWKLIQPTNYIEDSDDPPLIDENFNYMSSDDEV